MSSARAEQLKKEGDELFEAENYIGAAAKYTKAIRLCQFEGAYYEDRSSCYIMLEKYAEAQNDSRKAIDLNPALDTGYVNLFKSALKLGDVSACTQVLDMIPKLPDDVKGKIDLEGMKLSLKRLKRIYKELQDALDLRNYNTALSTIDFGLTLASADVELFAKKAELLYKLERYQNAVIVVDEVMRRSGKFTETLFLGGKCHYQLDNMDKAKFFLTKMLKMCPNDLNARKFNRQMDNLNELREKAGKLSKTGKDSEEALKLYNQALVLITLERSLKNRIVESKLCYNIGITLCRISQDNKDEGMKMFNRAIELNPNYDKPRAIKAAIDNLKHLQTCDEG